MEADQSDLNYQIKQLEKQVKLLFRHIRQLNETIDHLNHRIDDIANWDDDPGDPEEAQEATEPLTSIDHRPSLTTFSPFDSIKEIITSARTADFNLTIDLSEKKN